MTFLKDPSLPLTFDKPAKSNDPARADFLCSFLRPGFRAGYKQGPMEMVDIYQVLTHLLEIEPLPHNGTWSTVRPMLSQAAALGPAAGGAALAVQMALVVLVSTIIAVL